MTNKRYKRMAFWKYDLYPFLLWGPVNEKITDESTNGQSVYVDNYGGMVFNPVFILPYKEGTRLAKKLVSLKERKRLEDNKVAKLFNDLRDFALLEEGIDLGSLWN